MIDDADVERLIQNVRKWWSDLQARQDQAAAPPAPTAGLPILQGVNTAGMIKTFAEEFDALDFTRWSTVYPWNQVDGRDTPAIRGSSLPGNDEIAWYVNRLFPATADIRPWRVEGGELILTADKAPPALIPLLGYDQADARTMGQYPYTSGLLHTFATFRQRYGYFEAVARWKIGKGQWPGFWLLPAEGKPPELDILEVLGDRPDLIHRTVHTHDGSPLHQETFIPRDDAFHRIGWWWDAEKIVPYLDGQPGQPFATPSDCHVPMYILLNLAVGGAKSWPGAPDYFTPWPGELRFRAVNVWSLPA